MNNIDIDKYNDINYLSSLLFDVLYNKKMERAVSIESVDIKDVKVSNILKNYEGAELTNLINSVFNRDITYLYKNIKKYTFKINDIVNGVDIVLKDINNINTLLNNDNMNKVMTYLLSDLVIKKKTKHILMNIFNFTLKYDEIKIFLEKYLSDETISKSNKLISVELREHYFKMDNLFNILNDKLIEVTDNDMKILIFQVLHTLAIIQEKYPTFKHNNLDLKNIYCYLKEKTSSTYEYILEGNKYIVPNIGLEIKITNFDDSIISDVLDNESIIDSLKKNDNTYDIKIFLDSLMKINNISDKIKIFIKDIMNNINNPKQLIFSNSTFNSFKSKSDLNNVSYDNKLNLSEMDSSISEMRDEKSNKLSEMDTEVSVDVKRSSKKRSSKKSKGKMNGGGKKSSKKSSKSSSEKSSKKHRQSRESSSEESESESSSDKPMPKLDDMSSDIDDFEDNLNDNNVTKAPKTNRPSIMKNTSSRGNKIFAALNGDESDLNMRTDNLPMVPNGLQKHMNPNMLAQREPMSQSRQPFLQPREQVMPTQRMQSSRQLMPTPRDFDPMMMGNQMDNPMGGPMGGPIGNPMGNPMMGNPMMGNQMDDFNNNVMEYNPGMMPGQGMMAGQGMMPPGMMPPGMMPPGMMPGQGMMPVQGMMPAPGMMQGGTVKNGHIVKASSIRGGGKRDNFFFESSLDSSSKNSNDLNKLSLKYKSNVKKTGGMRIIPAYIDLDKISYKPKLNYIGGVRIIPRYIDLTNKNDPYKPLDEASNITKQYIEDKKAEVPISYSIPPAPRALQPDEQVLPSHRGSIQAPPPQNSSGQNYEQKSNNSYEPRPQNKTYNNNQGSNDNALNGTTQAYITTPNTQGASVQLNIPPAAKMPQKIQNTFNPTYYVPMLNPYPATTEGNPMLWHPAVPPIVQKYNITFGSADVTRLGEVYEDLLPSKIAIAKNTFNSLSERLLVVNYLRSVLVRNSDGEEINFDQKKKGRPEINALLSHLKIIGVNPYNYNKMTNNPYTGLPDRLLVYKSCYPIKVSPNSQIKCANENIGINVRIYQELEGEAIMSLVGVTYKGLFEIWREITFYEYVRDEIVKKNVSPNFVSLISYFTHPRTIIDFVKYRLEKDTKPDPKMENYYTIYNSFVNNEIYKIPGFKEARRSFLEKKYLDQKMKFTHFKVRNQAINVGDTVVALNNQEEQINPKIRTYGEFIEDKLNNDEFYTNYSETCLIVLTEAPTQNIISWASKKFEQNNVNLSVLRMISTGYHDPDVWKSVLFQLHTALYVMHKKEICIWNFNLENNIYIKETNIDNNNIGFWKYIIEGIDFYIPNYGAILLIDTSFKDLDVDGTTINQIDLKSKLPTTDINRLNKEDFRYKIMMGTLFDTSVAQKQLLNQRNVELFKNNIFNNNEFNSQPNKISGMIPPDSTILDLIQRIGDYQYQAPQIPVGMAIPPAPLVPPTVNLDVANIIKSHAHYLHNKVGVLLTQTEIPVPPNGNTSFVIGEFVGHTLSPNNHYGAIIKSVPVPNQYVEIITIDRTQRNIVGEIRIVPVGEVIKLNAKPSQSFKPSIKIDEQDLVETYRIE